MTLTNEEAKKEIIDMANALQLIPNTPKGKAVSMAIKALEQEHCEDAISRQAVIDACDQSINLFEAVDRIKELESVTPQPKTGYLSIDDVMSVFDDFMCGEVDENGIETFLEMLKDKAESEDKEWQ